MRKLYFKDFTGPLMAHLLLEINQWQSETPVDIVNVETLQKDSIQMVNSFGVRVWYNVLR